MAELKRMQSETEPIIKIFENEEVVQNIQNTRSGGLRINWGWCGNAL